MKTPFIILFFSILTFCRTSLSQDTIWLVDGKTLPVLQYKVVVENGDSTLEYTNLKGKRKIMPLDAFYFAGHGNNLIYNGVSPDEIEPHKQFSLGLETALLQHKATHCMAAGFIIGIGSAFIPPLNLPIRAFETLYFSPLIPTSFSIFARNNSMHNSKTLAEAQVKSNNEDFKLGYLEGAKKKRGRNALLGSIIGFATGIAVITAVQ